MNNEQWKQLLKDRQLTYVEVYKHNLYHFAVLVTQEEWKSIGLIDWVDVDSNLNILNLDLYSESIRPNILSVLNPKIADKQSREDAWRDAE